MTPGRRSLRPEFTLVPSHGSIFVYMIPPQNAMPARVIAHAFSAPSSSPCTPGVVAVYTWEVLADDIKQLTGVDRKQNRPETTPLRNFLSEWKSR